MKRKPCMKVPLPVSPKRKLRSCSSSPAPPAKDFDRQTRSNVGPENESDSQPDVTELKSKSPFYKKVIDQQQVAETKKACAKEITYSESKEQTSGKLDDRPVSAVDQSGITPVNAADQSGVSLNSSYLTLSTADTSNLSQGSSSTDTCSQDRFSNSQSSKDGFTFSKPSDDSDQLDYNDTPNTSLLSPRNRTLTNPGKFNSSVSSKSASDSPAVEVIIERDIVEFIDYDNLDSDQNKDTTPLEEIGSGMAVSKPVDAALVGDARTRKTAIKGEESGHNGILVAEIGGTRHDKVDANTDENNNVRGVASLNENSDQAVMTKTYQNEAAKRQEQVINLETKNNDINGVQHNGLADSNVVGQDKHSKVLEAHSASLQNQSSTSFQDTSIPGQTGLKEATIPAHTTFSAVMPSDLEPRQLLQTRQEPSCLLSPITEENAVERVAKELVNTYGGQNSHRIPDFLQDHTRLSDYDYNASFGPSLQFQQPRDPRQYYTQQQVHQNTEYPGPGARHDIPRDPLGLQGHVTNNIPFGEPQGSSTPEIYQRRPICFSPDDFPSPYHYDAPPSNQQWLGGSGTYQNSDQQNSRPSDYFLPENPIGPPPMGGSFIPIGQQRSSYRGKGIIDLPGGGDYRPAPQVHDNTTMTFTPRSLMESHLSSSYVPGSSQSLPCPRQSYPPLGVPTQASRSLRNMDCSSIYPSRDFIEKASGTYHKRTATPAKIPSFENLVPPSKRRKLRSLSETDIGSDKELDGYHLGLPPLESNCGPPRHKYYVVNPSDAVSMAPKTLIGKYIDFLILENEQITEISKSVSQPIDIYVTEDMYFMDTLKCRVPYPSKKFMEWVRSFYPKLKLQNMRFHGMPGKHGDLPRGEDKRQTQQVLEDIFYYFQRQVMNLED